LSAVGSPAGPTSSNSAHLAPLQTDHGGRIIPTRAAVPPGDGITEVEEVIRPAFGSSKEAMRRQVQVCHLHSRIDTQWSTEHAVGCHRRDSRHSGYEYGRRRHGITEVEEVIRPAFGSSKEAMRRQVQVCHVFVFVSLRQL
jgi:hypothetical protein